MNTETNQEAVVDAQTNEQEVETQTETISIPKKDYETLNQTLGSLKRELKDLKKSKDDSGSSQTTKSDENVLLQKIEKQSLRIAGITHQDDIDFARATAKKWGMDIDEVLEDDDFKTKLERQQTARNNAAAVSNVRGGPGTQSAKTTPEYWAAKGVPPTAADVPDRKTRAAIARAMIKSAGTSGKKFYND